MEWGSFGSLQLELTIHSELSVISMWLGFPPGDFFVVHVMLR